MPQIVNFQSVSKSFGDKLLLDKVSFSLNKGTINTLIGQNGAGKTTIAKMMLGLEEPTSGKVVIDKNITIGYVPQKLDFNFNMPLTCLGLLKMLSPDQINGEEFIFSEFLDYKNINNKDISNISAGQLQKILLAGTLMQKPDLIILDEPTQFLDVSSQKQFYHVLTEAKEKFGSTIFMVSHDLFTVMKNSDQVICINGHICCSGRPADLENMSDLKDALSEIGFYVHSHDHKH